jgi:glycerate kinase
MKILVASNSFKGTLSSREVGRIVQEGLSGRHQVDYIPVSDGGEGFLESVAWHVHGRLREIPCMDPLDRKIPGHYLLADNRTAFIESAMTCGPFLLASSERNPLNTSTHGLGLIIRDAIRQGAGRIFIGLGGSVTNDGGTGMLRTLGAVFHDKNGDLIMEGGGKILGRIASIDVSGMDPSIRKTSFTGVCDVDNPLLGNNGATRIYGPQKGATPAMVEILEIGMASFAEVVGIATGNDHAADPGAGAAGGLGFCLKSFLDARLKKGLEFLADITGLEDRINQYDLIITGEGRLDEQTGSGKVPMGILQLGQKYRIPVACICAMREGIRDWGFVKEFVIVPGHASLADSLAAPETALRKLVAGELLPWINHLQDSIHWGASSIK